MSRSPMPKSTIPPHTIETVRARIARGRVAEMLARGWILLGPAEDGTMLMEGPEPDAAPQSIGRWTSAIADAAWECAVARLEARLHAAA